MSQTEHTNERWLRVELEVDPSPALSCPMTQIDREVENVRINAVGDRCIVEVTPVSDDSIVRLEGSVGDACLCATCQETGCAPQITRINDGTLYVTAYVTSRADVRCLVGGLRELATSVRVASLAISDDMGVAEEVTFDLTTLTAKQREAFELAVRRGYLEDDSDLKLADLASELGISKAALSQRMRSGQAKLIKSVFEDAIHRTGREDPIEPSAGSRGTV